MDNGADWIKSDSCTCTTIVFQGSREQLFKDKKNDIRNWLTTDPAGL